jgi:transposase
MFIGVDTLRVFHDAVALSGQGAVLGEMHLPTRSSGYEALLDWKGELAGADCTALLFGIEGTGSYGAGLYHFLQIAGCQMREVNRPNGQARRQRGKGVSIDAELAARALIAGTASAIAKSRNTEAEMLRILKSTRDSAARCRTKPSPSSKPY